MSRQRSLAAHAGSIALLLCFQVAACNGGSSGGSGVLTPGLTNTGVSVAGMVGAGDLRLLIANEALEHKDLNGDGDQLDQVATVYDLFDGSRHALGLALSLSFTAVTVGDVLIAFGVPEDSQGQTDLNGDGDVDDTVLFVYDNRTGVVTNSGFAMGFPQPAIGAGLVSFGVDELAQGATDFDGDGLTASTVLFVYDSRTGLSTNSTRAMTSEIVVEDHEFAFTTTEAVTGDLNGDGDASDTHIFQLYDGELGGVVTAPVETLGPPIPLDEDWYVLVSESGENQDLNGDGDLADGVWFALHPHFGTKDSLGLSSLGAGALACGSVLTLFVQEIDGIDRNGDGDASDDLWAIYDPSSGTSAYIDLAAQTLPVWAGGRIAFSVSEFQHGADLNGDGDVSDQVLELVDPELATIENTGLDLSRRPEAWGSRLFLPRRESTNGADWNGDGDQLDEVFWTFDPRTGEARSTGIASQPNTFGATENELLLVVAEDQEGRDLNGDGDRSDLVYVLHDLATHENRTLQLATDIAFGVGLTPDGQAALLVSEAQQESDLNHDGDRDDQILFVLE